MDVVGRVFDVMGEFAFRGDYVHWNEGVILGRVPCAMRNSYIRIDFDFAVDATFPYRMRDQYYQRHIDWTRDEEWVKKAMKACGVAEGGNHRNWRPITPRVA